MTERQKHGFLYEQRVLRKYNITPSKTYTDEWDGFFHSTPVSVKTKKLGNAIEMGDIFRNS